MMRITIFLALVLALAGCGEGSLLRDDYFGRSWLEPSRSPTAVKRDGNGNPILPPGSVTTAEQKS
jgi:hypothetical protein